MGARDLSGEADESLPGTHVDTRPGPAARTATFWIHQSSFLFRRDKPDKVIETVWIAHPGWGYIRRRDLWIPVECDLKELHDRGFFERKPDSNGEVSFCPHCGMYITGVPGYLVQKHTAQCGGSGEDPLKMEEEMISERRIAYYQKLIADRIEQEKTEQDAQEKKERFDKIREEQVAKQQQRDRKKRLKEATKREWKDRWKDK